MPIMASNARFAFIAAGRQCLCQHARRDLPGDAPLVLTPATRTLLASIADNGVPVAVGLPHIIGGDLKRESFVMLERGTSVEAETGDAGDCTSPSLPEGNHWVNDTHRALLGKVSA